MFLLYLIAKIVSILLMLELDAMFLRAILSWFDTGRGGFLSMVTGVLTMITEPIVLPVRFVLSRFPAANNLPFDISFFVTFLLLSLLRALLPAL